MLFRATLVLLSQIYAFAALDEVYRSQTHESPVTKIITSEGVSVSGDRSGNLIVYKQTATGFIKDSLKATHNKAINSLYLMDGKILASGDAQGKIALWDTVTNSEIVSLELHTVPVVALHLKKNSSGDIEVYSFDRNGNGLVTTLVGFKVSSKKTFSVNGNYRAARFVETSSSVELAIGERAGTISRFNIKSNNELRADNSARNPVVDISCDSLQKSCAYATRDKTIKVFDTQMKLVKSYATTSNKARLSSAKGILYYVDNNVLHSVRTRSATKVDKVEHGLFNVETISVNQENRLVILGDRNGEVVFYKVTDSNDTVTVDDSLKKAICAKDVDGIRDLVKNGANVNAVDKDGNNALMNVYSCKLPMYTRNKILKVLLEGEAADVNQYNRDGKNFYDLAGPEHINVELLKNHVLALSEDLATEVEYENISEIERLLDLGADVNHLDFFDQTPLMAAAVNGNTELVSLLLNHKWIDLNIKNNLDQTVFDLDITDEAKVLIDEYKFRKETGRKLISDGVNNNDLSLVKKAVEEYGINVVVEDVLFDRLGEQARTVPSLYQAIRNKNVEIMRYLLSKGAFTSFKNNYFVNLIRYALDLESLDLLIEYGVDIERNKEACDNIFVQYSQDKGNLDILKKIYLEYGYSLESKQCDRGRTTFNIIQNIVVSGDRLAFRWFVENTDVDLSNTQSEISLVALAIAYGHTDILQALIAKGLPLEVKTLPYVIRFNEDGSLFGGDKLLRILKKHLNPNARLDSGYFLYDIIMSGNQKTLDFFLSLGAKLNIEDVGHFNYPIEAILEKENKKLLDKFLDEGGDLNKAHIKEDHYSVYHLSIIQGKYDWLKNNSAQLPVDVQNRNGASFTHIACYADNMDLSLNSSQDMVPLLEAEDVLKGLRPSPTCRKKIEEIRNSVEDYFKKIDKKSDEEIIQFVESTPYFAYNKMIEVNGTLYRDLYRALLYNHKTTVFGYFANKGKVDRYLVFDVFDYVDHKSYLLDYIVSSGIYLDSTERSIKKLKLAIKDYSKYLQWFVESVVKHKNSTPKFLNYILNESGFSNRQRNEFLYSSIDFDVEYNGNNILKKYLDDPETKFIRSSYAINKYLDKFGKEILSKSTLYSFYRSLINDDPYYPEYDKYEFAVRYIKALDKYTDINNILNERSHKDEISFVRSYISEFVEHTNIDFSKPVGKWLVYYVNFNSDTDYHLIDEIMVAAENGLNPNLKLRNGDTFLIGLIKSCSSYAVERLLKLGANKKIKNSAGLTPYSIAKKLDRKKCLWKSDIKKVLRRH